MIFKGFRKLFIREQKGVVEPFPELWVKGKLSSSDFSTFYTYYKTHPLVKSSVDSLAGMIAGVGFYTTVDDNKDPRQIQAKEVVDEFNAKVNMDELLLDVAKDLLITGNSFLEKIFDGSRLTKVKRLPTSKMKIIRDKYGEVLGYVEEITGNRVEFKPEEVVHFKWNDIDLSGYGVGIVQPVKDYIEFDKKNMENMTEVVYKTAYPIPIFTFKNKTDIDYFIEVLKKRNPGDPILTVGEIQPTIIQVDSRIRFGEFIESVERKLFEGMRAPLLSWLRNATEASANVMLECVERDVKAMQRYIKRKVEGEIWKPLLKAYSLDDVHVKLNWGFPKSGIEDLRIRDLVDLARADVGILSRSQVLKMLQMMGIPVPEPEPPKFEEEIKEQFGWKPQWYDLTNEIVLQLINPSQIDRSTIRYQTIDADKGIRIQTAWVKGAGRRFVTQIRFDRAYFEWTLDKAKDWYKTNFPYIYEFIKQLEKGE
ncbi:hypothetical protein DRO30_01425 [Candidatus Bathyarchaeota archaeon]|nr:MAG: hypothetical protein DRO30_01425 [Candidatus Bathyarchaeota archaeon]